MSIGKTKYRSSFLSITLTTFAMSILLYAGIIAQHTSQFQSQPNTEITANIKRHLHYLGSDIFEGRGTGTLGGELAAKYLALSFDDLKLQPVSNDNTYYQKIPMHGSIPLNSSQLIVYSDSTQKQFDIYEDYLLFKTGEQTYIPTPLEVVFAGYGIVAPEYDYSDYNSIDVEGKIVVVLDGEPRSNDTEYFDSDIPTVYSLHESKVRIALSRGAAGCMIIPNLSDPNFSWEELKREYQFEDVRLAYSAADRMAMIINSRLAKYLFEESGYSLKSVCKMQNNGNIKSFPLSRQISFKGEFKERDFITSNIVGMIEGKDPVLRDSYLIISAHYDHLGTGPAIANDSIYNGVQDNAIGCAVLLELAREFKKPGNAPSRSIIFLLLTGEEKGLLGSTYYTENPIVPLYKTVANINIDGIAVFDKFKSITGIGVEYSTLSKFLQAAANSMNLQIKSIQLSFEYWEAFYKSDQLAFAKAGIPSIITMEGLDYDNITTEAGLQKFKEYGESVYHTPFDDLTRPIDFSAVLEHFNFLYRFAESITNSYEIPEWKSGSPYINARLRSIAEKK